MCTRFNDKMSIGAPVRAVLGELDVWQKLGMELTEERMVERTANWR